MKIIFFSSHTATWFFALTEAKIAYEFKRRGHNVLLITPGNKFAGISSRPHEKILKREFGLDGYEIGSTLDSEDYKKINLIVNKLNKNNFEKLELEGIEIGKIALYEFLLNHKKMSIDLSDREWINCKREIKNALISFFACKKVVKLENPDRIVMYNSLYSVNHVWEKHARSKKIPVYFMHHGLNLSDMDNTLIVGKNNAFYYFNELKKVWKKFRNYPITKDKIDYVNSHFEALFRAKHQLVYSSPMTDGNQNIRKGFGIRRNQKILLATMSSYDEMFAAEYVGGRKKTNKLIFSDQAIWLKSLINYVKKFEDLFLIIRVHPREFPNKRERVKSEHAKKLEKMLIDLPKNVKVNWPKDNLSIYNLAKDVDVVLNAWSTVGVEMSLLGVPVVTYAKDLINYPADLNYTALNKQDYFKQINKALKIGRNFKFTKMTYRWLSLFYCDPIIRLRPRNKTGSVDRKKTLLSIITNYVYSKFPLAFRSHIVNVKNLEDSCKLTMKEKVDVHRIEDMFIKNEDTLIKLSQRYLNVTKEDEEEFMSDGIRQLKI